MKSESFTYLDMKNDKIEIMNSVKKNIFKTPFQLDIVFSSHIKLLIDITIAYNQLNESFNVECENACSTSDCYILKDILKDEESVDVDKNKYYGVINTGTIGQFVSRWGKKEMTYLGDKYLRPVVNKADFHRTFPNSYGAKAFQQEQVFPINGKHVLGFITI